MNNKLQVGNFITFRSPTQEEMDRLFKSFSWWEKPYQYFRLKRWAKVINTPVGYYEIVSVNVSGEAP